MPSILNSSADLNKFKAEERGQLAYLGSDVTDPDGAVVSRTLIAFIVFA